jgi:ubiquinone/menaquinone biosynthesis C-methylase UbiE
VVKLAGEQGLEAVGVDISEVAAHSARNNVNSLGEIGVSTGENLPFSDDSFDFVTNIGSLEHFFDPPQGVREMARVLRPSGKAFVLLPNTFSLLTNILVAWRTGETSIDEQPIQRYGAREDWKRLLEQNGLRVTKTIKYERPWPQTMEDWKYYLRRPKEMFRLLANPIVPLNLTFCFIFTCEKANPTKGNEQ